MKSGAVVPIRDNPGHHPVMARDGDRSLNNEI